MNRMLKTILPSLIVGTLLVGCVGYKHKRSVRVFTQNGIPQTNTVETTRLYSLFKKADAEMVKSSVKDGEYSRSIGIGAVTSSGDAASIKAMGGAVGEAAKTFVGNPSMSTLTDLLEKISARDKAVKEVEAAESKKAAKKKPVPVKK